jgi:lysophospholipase L1-like esterase
LAISKDFVLKTLKLTFSLAMLLVCTSIAIRTYKMPEPTLFYATAVGAAVAFFILIQSAGLTRQSFFRTLSLTPLVMTLLLPVADFVSSFQLKQAAAGPAKPAYTYRDAKGDPAAFKAWWAHYVSEWELKSKGEITAPDPEGILPYVFKPNTQTRFFETIIHINNLGFAGSHFAADKGNRFRIFALGESPTFGAMVHRGDRPWPEVLQSMIDENLACARPIQVINAGSPAYNLKHNLERVKRDILPLAPDLILSSDGANGLAFLQEPDEDHFASPLFQLRASALLSKLEYRWRVWQFVRERRAPNHQHYSLGRALKSRYAALYQQLIELSKQYGFQLVLTNQSASVTNASPVEVVDFYFPGQWGSLTALATHSLMVETLARENNIHFMDTTAGIAGHWDEDLFLDFVHFTQKGSDRLAQKMFDGLRPLLASNPTLMCADRSP